MLVPLLSPHRLWASDPGHAWFIYLVFLIAWCPVAVLRALAAEETCAVRYTAVLLNLLIPLYVGWYWFVRG